MTADLTPEALDRLAELRAKGTPGEWKFPHRNYPDIVTTKRGCVWNPGTGRINDPADAALIVAAVNALPGLVAAARERDQLRQSLMVTVRIHTGLIDDINDALGLDPDDDQTCVPGCEDGPAGSAHSLWHLIQQRDQATTEHAEVRAKELEDAADAEPGWPVKPWLRARAARIRGEQP